jgi:hypothetical protein
MQREPDRLLAALGWSDFSETNPSAG